MSWESTSSPAPLAASSTKQPNSSAHSTIDSQTTCSDSLASLNVRGILVPSRLYRTERYWSFKLRTFSVSSGNSSIWKRYLTQSSMHYYYRLVIKPYRTCRVGECHPWHPHILRVKTGLLKWMSRWGRVPRTENRKGPVRIIMPFSISNNCPSIIVDILWWWWRVRHN